MQCQIRGMEDVSEAARSTRDTLPRPGLVNEVCREWVVKEDGALAYHLQSEEIKHHYVGNKSRNAQVREDFPKAKDEQKREEERAAAIQAMYNKMIFQQEEIDSRIAKQLADRIEREEDEKKKAIEIQDEQIAMKLQEREKCRIDKRSHSSGASDRVPPSISDQFHHDINSVGLPLPSEYSDYMSDRLRSCSLREANSVPKNPNVQDDYSLPVDVVEKLFVDEDEEKRKQEEEDAEFARLLQEQERMSEKDMLTQDRLMAIEAQDKELARLLQEKERAKARRARERAKAKALMKKQQQLQQQQHQAGSGASEDEGLVASPTGFHSPQNSGDWNENGFVPQTAAIRPTDLDLRHNGSNVKRKPRYPDPEEIEELPSCSEASHTMPNIAMAIDPTYTRWASTTRSVGTTPMSPASSELSNSPVPSSQDYSEQENPVPPYMPIQGQRRTASLEKKSKKGRTKDGCKQQ